MPNSDQLCVPIVKLVFLTYVIPCIILYYIMSTIDVPLDRTVTFLFAYLVFITIVNCFTIRKMVQRQLSEVDAEAGKLETPQPEAKDEPPSYVEATEQPPPYSVLKYYKRIMRKTPFIRRNNSLEKNSRNVVSVPSGAGPSTSSRPSLKRNQSSPN